MNEALVTASYLKRKFPNDPKMREVIDFINRSVYYLHQEYLNNGPDPQGEYKWKRNIVDLNVKMVAALGHGHEMHGNLSTILGNYGNITRAYRETIMGSFATDLAGSATLWVPDDRLWEVGKGPDKDHRAFALRQYKNGFMMLANALAISAFSSGGMLPVDGSIQYINKRLQLYFDEIWHDLAFKSELHPAVTIAEDSTDKLEINDNQVLAIKNVIPLSLTTVSPILSTDLIVIKRVDTPYQATVGAFETYFNTKYSLLGHTHIISDIPGLQTALNNKLETSLKGTPNGLAELDANGFVLNTQLPSYVDDVLEFANYASLPVTGESGKIYITQDDNKTYRWSGTGYAIISDTLALGETYATAYRGDRGKIAYDYSQIGHVQLNDTRIANWNAAYSWGNHAGLYKAIGWLPTWAEVTGKPSFFSGDYNDLINKPTIPAAQVNSDWNATSGVAQILNKPSLFDGNYNSLTNKPTLFSGSYTDLTNKPYIPDSYTKTESDGRYSLLGHAHDYLTDAPADNSYYARKNNAWAALTDLNNYPTAIAFTNGNLAVSRYGLTDISVPLDGRYSLLGHTHPYLTDSDARIAQWNTAYTHSQTAHQSIINGTGFLKNNGAGTWSYDSNSYALSTHNHAGVYEPVITKGTTAQYFRGDMSLATFPTSLPASDVYAWAKASTKPSYSYSEVGAASSGHNHDGWYDYYGAWILNVNSGANYYVYGYNTVNFIAGSNITLSQSGANITISATGSGSMVYPSAGIAVSTGSAWGTSITNNSANWNTAYNNMGKVYVGTGTTGCVMNGYYFASNISNAVVLNLSTSPTSGDGLPITSGGVYTALAGKAALAGSSSQAFSTANLTVSGTISATGTITGSEVYRGSSRSLKYNIQELTESALSILNATRIHTYNMLADHSFSIGFIAEDTHAWLSGNERKGHIFGNHLGLLTKAIQEEDAKVAELQREIVQLKNEIKILKHGNC